ncbi:MAG: hypothetical protein RLZZ623_3055 [Actinomycetota bacterium]
MARRISPHSATARAGALGALALVAGVVAVLLHRHGHTQGDDFALYLRQARSVFEGDTATVVGDNRFAVVNSDHGFSPMAYPWGWPLLLSPFVHLWGLDYDRLKLVEVGVFITWIVLLHGIVRRRVGRTMALGIAAVIGTAPLFLVHTDQLLTEFPHVAAVAVVVWWYDRVRAKGSLLGSSTADLVVLGVLVTVAFNVRREGLVLIGVIGVMQVAELLDLARESRNARVRRVMREVRERYRTILTPHAAFVGSLVLFQLLLPTMLLPDNGNSRRYIDNRFGDYAGVLTQHLGIGDHPAAGVTIVMVAIVGVVVGVRRRPSLDGPLALLALFSALAIGTHFRMVDRYWFQVTPWVVYFAAVAILEGSRFVISRRARLATVIAVVPLAALVIGHAVVLPGDISAARHFNSAGRTQVGPAHPDVIPIYDAVRDRTPPGAVIAFFRARTMTLLTDRRSIQTTSLDRMRQRADYFAQRLGDNYWQPKVTAVQAEALGFEKVWSNSHWILWKLTPP